MYDDDIEMVSDNDSFDTDSEYDNDDMCIVIESDSENDTECPEFNAYLETLIPEITDDVKNFEAGKLRKYSENWGPITRDAWVFNTLKGADIELDALPNQRYIPRQMAYSKTEHAIIELEIKKLLTKKVIVPSTHEDGDFISNVFVRDKKDGTHRMILNLKALNEDLKYQKFKMECLNQALDLIPQGSYMASIDLKDAYYSVPIAQQYRKYLKFAFDGKLYCFTCLPNGLSPAPRIFTKLLKPVFSSLRKVGHVSTVYIDDSLLIGKDRPSCEANVKATVSVLRQTGFTVHPVKSVFKPVQRIQYIGFLIDSKAMTVSLPHDKMLRIQASCQKLLKNESPTIQEVAEVVGQLVAALPAITMGQMRYRALDNCKTKALKLAKGKFSGRMTLTPIAKSDLKWWIQHLPSAHKSFLPSVPKLVIHSDASNEGWGGGSPKQAPVYRGTMVTERVWPTHQ